MSSTLRVSVVVEARDFACKPHGSGESVRDAGPTTHDLIDATPLGALSTSGGIGTRFLSLPTVVAQVQRIVGDFPTGTDVLLRFGGVAAFVLGASGALTIEDGWTLSLAVDGGPTVTVEFMATDTTPALAAKRINYAAGAQVASVDAPSGRLRLDGVNTGGTDARAKGRLFGAVDILGGTALAALGLVVGTTSGDGDDVRVGAGPLVHTFPSGAQPRRIELSGSASGARLWVAGAAT